jgi:inositol transport system substrate-binding protein
MSIRKILVLVIVLALSLGMLAGCAQSTTAGTTATTASGATTGATTTAGAKKTVGVMIADMSAQFQAYIADGMKEEAKKYPNITFVFVDGKFDSSIQMGQAENFIAQKVDALIYIPGDSAASKNLVDKVVAANIPIIGVNTAPAEPDKLTTYAGSDSIESGRILMNGLAEAMGKKGSVFELQGFMGHEPQILRHQGIMEALKNYPDITYVGQDTGEWSRDKAMQAMENVLNSDLKGKFTAVVCHNDEMAIGAMKALEAAGVKDVLVAGIDANPEALKYVKEGKLALTVFQDAKGQGAMGIDLAAKITAGEKVEKNYMIPYVLVTKADVDKYLK